MNADRIPRRGVVLAAALLLIAAAGGRADEPAPGVRSAELGSTARVHEFDGALLASQPGQADLKLARERGIRTVISLRHDTEAVGFDERAEAAQLGLQFENVPWLDASELTDEVFAQVRQILDRTERPLLLHCGSGNRVGAVWIPWRVLDGGVPYEDALAEAKEIGLVTPAYEQQAKAYVERQQSAR